jgi:putative toxin-antitoxin system antitoxin component (TIGR02293 family)
MSAVERGLPLTALDRVVHSVAPTDNKFAFRIIARATLARRRKAWASTKDKVEGRLSAEEGTRLARLAGVWAMAVEVWGNQEDARRFMFDAKVNSGGLLLKVSLVACNMVLLFECTNS